MPEQHVVEFAPTPSYNVIPPEAALGLLDEAWAYFSPGLDRRLPANQYGDDAGNT